MGGIGVLENMNYCSYVPRDRQIVGIANVVIVDI
jgi:hypothetical protein